MRSFALVALLVQFLVLEICAQINFEAIDADPVTVYCLVNKARMENCLAPLGFNTQLNQIALGHSQDMSARNIMSHLGQNGQRVGWRLNNYGWNGRWSQAGENLGQGYTDPIALVRAWLASSEHRKNLLNPDFTLAGYGYAPKGNFWTEVLVKNTDGTSRTMQDCSRVSELSVPYVDLPSIRSSFTSQSYCSANSPPSSNSVAAASAPSSNAPASSSSTGDQSSQGIAVEQADSGLQAAPITTTASSPPSSDTGRRRYAIASVQKRPDGSTYYVYNRANVFEADSAQQAVEMSKSMSQVTANTAAKKDC